LFRRVVRNLPDALERLGSAFRLFLLKVGYRSFKCGKGVFLRHGAQLRMVPEAQLTIGDRTVIDRYATVICDGDLSIGSDGYIGQGTVIVAIERISIGSDVLIAAHSTIRDQDHGIAPGPPYRTQPPTTKPIIIGSNVWLGANAVILKGVDVGDGAVIGAGAVVRTRVPSRHLAVGVPATTKPLAPRG
jgi:acetyltransferase-like isoleucine patch superfamily enzyme